MIFLSLRSVKTAEIIARSATKYCIKRKSSIIPIINVADVFGVTLDNLVGRNTKTS